MLQSSKKISPALRQSFMYQHQMKGEWGLQKRYIRFSYDYGLKNKSIHLRDFKDVDFNFPYFANFKFAYFEIEVSFGLIWVNLQNGRFHLQISILGT